MCVCVWACDMAVTRRQTTAATGLSGNVGGGRCKKDDISTPYMTYVVVLEDWLGSDSCERGSNKFVRERKDRAIALVTERNKYHSQGL